MSDTLTVGDGIPYLDKIIPILPLLSILLVYSILVKELNRPNTDKAQNGWRQGSAPDRASRPRRGSPHTPPLVALI